MSDDPKKEITEVQQQLTEKDAKILELRDRVAELEQNFAGSNDGDDQHDDDVDDEKQDVSLKDILENPEVTKLLIQQ